MLKLFNREEEYLIMKVSKKTLPPMFTEAYNKLVDMVEKPQKTHGAMVNGSGAVGKEMPQLNKEMLDSTIISCGLSKLLSEYKNFVEGKMVDMGFLKFGSQIMEGGNTNVGGEETKRYFVD